MQLQRWKFAVIAVITAIFLSFVFAFPQTLGIDLAGGTELRYDLDLSGIPPERRSPALTKSTADILSRRLDSLGLAEMTIRPVGDYSIMIQLPGVSSTRAEQIKDAIRTSGNLWFKIVYRSESDDWVRLHRTDPEILELIQDVLERKDRGEYYPDEEPYDVATYEIREKTTGRVIESFPILLENDDAVPGKYLEGADPDRDQFGAPAVAFYMKPEGAAKLAETTERNVGRAMAIVLDGVVVSAPKIRSTISDRGQITGSFTKQEVDTLVTVLRSGALPAKPVLASEDTIAPTLGEDSIRRGMFAVVTAVILTFLFMFVFYRGAGMVANVALVLNLIILFGTMKLLGATLTLPGIAGIVLVMGMAVDANILINERIREEFDRGVPIGEAVAAGFRHAFSAILDSNVTTVLTAIILYTVGTGPIRGFAITLMIGIVSSLFTALWVTRAFFELMLARGWYTRPNYLRVLANPNIGFLKNRRPFVLTALILLNLGYIAFAMRGPEKY
ncbi:MAG: protein translocase subunit SecD, partial [Planctomycetota bacterium]